MTYVIGIDGGGTKTKAILANEKGDLFASVQSGPSNPNSVEETELYDTLINIFESLKHKAANEFHQVSICYAGMSGVGVKPEKSSLYRVLTDICKRFDMEFVLNNDGINALYAGTNGQDGIVHISGTGSITYAVYNKVVKRVGGWGYLFDDLGSGYFIGKEALAAIFQEYDGRGKSTSLTEKVLNRFSLEYTPEIVPYIYERPNNRTVISRISELTFNAYGEGDEVSQIIIQQAVTNISCSINALANQIYDEGAEVDVVLSGGLLKRADILVPLLEDKLKDSGFNFRVMVLYVDPVIGAVIGGLKSLGVRTPSNFVEEISSNL